MPELLEKPVKGSVNRKTGELSDYVDNLQKMLKRGQSTDVAPELNKPLRGASATLFGPAIFSWLSRRGSFGLNSVRRSP